MYGVIFSVAATRIDSEKHEGGPLFEASKTLGCVPLPKRKRLPAIGSLYLISNSLSGSRTESSEFLIVPLLYL